jgi:hypothetical protein
MKNKIFYAVTLFICALIITTSCLKKKANKIITTQVVTTTNQCDTTSFAKHIQPILKNSCNLSSCHGPSLSGRGDFSTYNTTKIKVDDGTFKNRVITLKNMPPSGLTTTEYNLIKCWVDKGTPNN